MKKPTVLPAFVVALIMCSTTLFGQLTDETYVHDGITRSYKFYLPPGISPSAPLVFVLHGYTGNASAMVSSTHMNTVADANGFAVCYPQGTADFTGTSHWNIGFPDDQVDDLGFLTNLAADLQSIHNLDPTCTYVCGMSNGAMMSYYLGCAAPETFHAIASVSGAITGAFAPSCSGNISVPFIEFHGTNDIIVPYNGGGALPTLWGEFFAVESVFKKWRMVNDCQNVNSQAIPEAPLIDYSSATRYDLTNCDGGLNATLFKIQNGGHTWPGSPSAGFWDFLQPTNQDVDASVEIWNFFSAVCSPSSSIASYSTADEVQEIDLYPNPALGQVNARLMGADEAVVRLYSLEGIKLSEQVIVRGENVIDLSKFSVGMYVVTSEMDGIFKQAKLVVK